ncbi:hypothetical protein TSAR_013193 [Trichomalopsis sarcophagae]|uniref:Reverse transcriptase Ty1/copia-type domain-containing protein n=1 Tax=Trichomalopsis sarcophagae TaxID=543379 RepID=A0A232FBV6_9HYME|nr:hypothetical protein TSAR_013193 [Trichomalopsis sarcophagae]
MTGIRLITVFGTKRRKGTFNDSDAPRTEDDSEPGTFKIMFGFEDAEDINAEPRVDNNADQMIDPDMPADQIALEIEPAAAEKDAQEGRQLRDRRRIPTPDRYGVPIAYLDDSENASKWECAMDEKMQSVRENNTWTLSTLPNCKQAIGCKCIYTVNSDATGNATRYKARLVAKGFKQREGIDYFDTFAPVGRY